MRCGLMLLAAYGTVISVRTDPGPDTTGPYGTGTRVMAVKRTRAVRTSRPAPAGFQRDACAARRAQASEVHENIVGADRDTGGDIQRQVE